MNIWAKMMTELRGGATELGEAIMDGQALQILDQQVRESTNALNQSKDVLASIIARQKRAQEKCAQLREQISENEMYVVRALDKGENALALEVAQKIADLENQLQVGALQSEQFEASVADLRSAVKQAEHNIRRLKQQVDTVKATETVQRAQATVAERFNGGHSRIRTAVDSLERMKEKQAFKTAELEAAAELADDTPIDSLQQRLQQAGIVAADQHAQNVLHRLRKNQSL